MKYLKLFEETSTPNTLYHGSPHRFDAFSLDFLGTGEGNQIFGWGIYFTDKKEIAADYAYQLFTNKNLVETMHQLKKIQKEYPIFRKLSFDSLRSIRELLLNSSSEKLDSFKEYAVEKLLSFVPDSTKWVEDENGELIKERVYLRKIATSIMEEICKSVISKNLYTIKANFSKCHWLEWYELVNTQNVETIKEKASKMGISLALETSNEEGVMYSFGIIHTRKEWLQTNEDLYKFLEHALGSQQKASMFLLACGYTGIKYPVNTLKIKTKILSNKANNYNYVLFDVALIKKVARKVV